jgi:hypothetical protein
VVIWSWSTTVSDSATVWLAAAVAESVTVAKNLNVPDVVGVPEMFSVLLRLKPKGIDPEAVHVYGGTPPATPRPDV